MLALIQALQLKGSRGTYVVKKLMVILITLAESRKQII
jgi:hypothetical protein